MQRLYKINQTCPGCGEEHLYWQIGLTDEEQAILDKHTEEHKGKSPIVPSRINNQKTLKMRVMWNRI